MGKNDIYAHFARIGASGWIYWNMILDTSGGPWLISPEHLDPVLNPQQPVIVVDVELGTFYTTDVYYALAHLGRYVTVGSTRVDVSSMAFPINV